MKKIYTKNSEKFIAYHNHFSCKNKAPYIIFSHGLMSSMNSSKALAIEEYCIKKEYNYIRYDNFGSGNSSGNFIEQNITSWLEGLDLIIDQLTSGPVILIGSSKGAWLSLNATLNRSDVVKGLITIAAATDFTEEIVWKNLTEKQKQEITEQGITNVTGEGSGCNYVYPMSYQLIQDGRQYLMLDKENIAINCPVHFIHGMQDIDVPYDYSLRTAEKLQSKQVVIKLIKDADHKLARPSDIQLITNSLEEILVHLE